MILLLILLLTAGIVLFGDVLVCIFIIFKVIKRLFRKKK